MRAASPPLLPVFRSRLQGDLLALLLADPDREWTVDELARHAGQPYQTVSAEVRRLQVGDLVSSRSIGRSKLVRGNPSSPYFEPLSRLAVMAFGPPVVVAEEFGDLAGVEQVMIFGSWAARYFGVSGPSPHDVDVLLIGTPDRDDAYDAAGRAQDRLGREVNVTIRTPQRWDQAGDSFTQQVKSSPLLVVLPRS